MTRRLILVLVVATTTALLPAAGASALTMKQCKGAPGFRCAVVQVPLDRTGAVSGTVSLHVAAMRPRRSDQGILLALAGGPGQSSLPAAQSFRKSLAPALRRRRLVVVDQRGTGASGALRCPVLQAASVLAPVSIDGVAACANALGADRQAYGTTDSVMDLDAVRDAFKVPRMAIMGVSYGTFVATQYARRFPDRVDWLVLDSIVHPAGVSPYLLESFSHLPRIVAEQCAGSACRLATPDPLADVAALVQRLRQGPLLGKRFDAAGRAAPSAVRDEMELFLMLVAGDLNPYLRAALPGAIAAALRGDPAMLLRLRRLAEGVPYTVKQISAGLNVTTVCADARLPYAFATPLEQRPQLWTDGLAGVPDSTFAPFSRAAVLNLSTAHDCLRWPQGDRVQPPSDGPLPDVPALLLSGRLDVRTPVENAMDLAAMLPRASLVPVTGSGHDVLDTDVTGCAQTALRLFVDGAGVGAPCDGVDDAVTPFPRPARTLGEYRRPPGVAGLRGRGAFAALDTIQDAKILALQSLYAGFHELAGGGLHGGSFRAQLARDRLILRRYSLVPGLRVTGTLSGGGGGVGNAGTVLVDGAGGLDGRLVLHSGGTVTGVLGGRRLHFQLPRAAARAAHFGGGRLAQWRSLPDLAAVARGLRSSRVGAAGQRP
jgi:pimeloyl-ACP methyl ester carboxylesterase